MRGTIAIKTKTGGGLDETANVPIPVSFVWSSEIECQYKPDLLSKNGRYDDGVYMQSSYIITTEDMNITGITVRLTDSRGNVVCEKEVISISVLEDIQRVKIII